MKKPKKKPPRRFLEFTERGVWRPRSGRSNLLGLSTMIDRDMAILLTAHAFTGTPIEYEPWEEEMDLDWDIEDEEEE